MHIQPLNEIQPTLAYHRVDESWEPWGPQTGFLYTAAVLTCGCCGAIISGMGGPGGPDWMCIPCYHTKVKNV